MKLFKTAKAIVSEISSMTRSETDRREDRATVSAFYNGTAPLTDAEAEELGITVNVNNLFGYTDIAAARDQCFGLYTKPTEIFSVQLDAAPTNLRQKWEMALTKELNEVVKGSRRFKPVYQGICGDSSLHGQAVMFHPNQTDWCPSHVSLSKMLIPDDAPIDTTQQTHWAIESELTISQLVDYSSGDLPGWKVGAIKRVLGKIYEGIEGFQADSIEAQNYEELEYARQRGGSVDGTIKKRPVLKVCYFYQVRSDLRGSPVDLTILVHGTEYVGSDDATDESRVLFESDAFFDNATETLHPFFMDCTIGGDPKWHRVLGLGHLNYTLNHAVELLVNRAMQGTMEGMMNLWQAKDSASREEIQQIVARHNGVIPENISLIQQRFQPDFNGTLSMIQFYRQQGSRNARQTQANNGDKNDMLEVQALAMQGQIGEQTSARTSNWYDYLDRVGEQIYARLVNPFIQAHDAGCSDIRKFQSRVERIGVPLYYAQPHNVKIRSVRILGDGNAQKEKAGAMWLSQNRAMFPPQSQQRITRMATAEMTGSYELAEELVPIEEQQDTTQIRIADDESNTCIVQGRSVPVSDSDVDEVHVPLHLNAMNGIVQRAAEFQSAAFTPQDMQAFKALGAHVVMHVQKAQSMIGVGKADENKRKSSMWMMALNEIVSLGEKFANNLKQQMEGQNEKPDPVEIAKLQIEAQKLELNRAKFEFGIEKWQAQQNLRENESAFNRVMKLEGDRRESEVTKRNLANDDVKTAAMILKTGGAE